MSEEEDSITSKLFSGVDLTEDEILRILNLSLVVTDRLQAQMVKHILQHIIKRKLGLKIPDELWKRLLRSNAHKEITLETVFYGGKKEESLHLQCFTLERRFTLESKVYFRKSAAKRATCSVCSLPVIKMKRHMAQQHPDFKRMSNSESDSDLSAISAISDSSGSDEAKLSSESSTSTSNGSGSDGEAGAPAPKRGRPGRGRGRPALRRGFPPRRGHAPVRKWRQAQPKTVFMGPIGPFRCGVKDEVKEALKDGEAWEFFEKIYDEEVLKFIVEMTNQYAILKIMKNSPAKSQRSFVFTWTPTTVDEMRRVLAVILAMGLNRKPQIRDYFSNNPIFRQPWFKNTLTGERFTDIFSCMLHVVDPDAIGREKIINFFQLLACFYPGREISIDESRARFKGRCASLQYNPQKPDKFRLEIFSLCDAESGYLWNAFPYFGSTSEYPDADPSLSVSEKVVDQLQAPLEEHGHVVFCDRRYTSIGILEKLANQDRTTFLTGTIMPTRRGLPDSLRNLRLDRNEARFWESEGMFVTAYRDKKSKKYVTILSNYGGTDLVQKTRRRGEVVSVPKIVKTYTTFMRGVDRFDQMIQYSSIVRRRTNKWWKKLFLWIFSASVVNAMIFFRLVKNEKVTSSKFRAMICEHYGGIPQPQVQDAPAPVVGRPKDRPEEGRLPKKRLHLVDYEGGGARRCRIEAMPSFFPMSFLKGMLVSGEVIPPGLECLVIHHVQGTTNMEKRKWQVKNKGSLRLPKRISPKRGRQQLAVEMDTNYGRLIYLNLLSAQRDDHTIR
ncbi:unnamed protein product [Cyprideis torosa]|uniref:PiggyBac transposable element-derived protein domain-containing protein n=1 Tax=Cyprideis torosa TaxID=163714 RepID=A0A7R8WM47_9CRUS|nr:unnamed protein product [Cyprideis torosa]CAG0902355.1 unnamed protein product [Cyprideis torosa]